MSQFMDTIHERVLHYTTEYAILSSLIKHTNDMVCMTYLSNIKGL